MKNSKLRTLLFSLILFASIGSYLYINSVQVCNPNVKCEAKQQLIEEEDKSNSEMPDVRIFKKLIEKGKEMIPSTQF